MSYILFVNPDILSQAFSQTGISQVKLQLLSATALSAGFGCVLMGWLARYPFALAPGMGLNAFFTFSVVIGAGLSWQQALGLVFISGLVFVLLSVTGVRNQLMNAIPKDLKLAMSVGIGLFLALIGMNKSGIVSASKNTLVELGDLSAATPALIGLVATAVLVSRQKMTSILIGIFVTSVAYFFVNDLWPKVPEQFIAAPIWPKDLLFKMDFTGIFTGTSLLILLSFLFVDFFDTAGTLYGIAEKGGFLDKNGRLERANQAFFADAAATTLGACLGSSPVTTYVESASGIASGSKSGRVALFVGGFFFISIFLWPWIALIPPVASAPALIVVGGMMIEPVRTIGWSDAKVAFPAFLTITAMPFTYSISTGIALGLVFYSILSFPAWKKQEWLLHLISLSIVIWFLFNI